MVLRKIVNINEVLCNGCGSCIPKCAEGALQIVNGKAKIVKDTYCDGLGACLGECPQAAITITEREADAFDEKAVHKYLHQREEPSKMEPPSKANPASQSKPQWPVKLNLVPIEAKFYQNAHLLLSADCAPIALQNFHNDLLKGKRILIGCPKFDDAKAYAQKLGEIIKRNDVASITVVHMEVPCCSALKWVANKALEISGKQIPITEHMITIGGEIQ